nr:unnamed protein product [Callosobruchus chinensis]
MRVEDQSSITGICCDTASLIVAEDPDILREQNPIRKEQKYADEKNWKRNKNKRLRMKGQKYMGFSKKKGETIKQNCPRGEGRLKKRFTSQKCLQSGMLLSYLRRKTKENSRRQGTYHYYLNHGRDNLEVCREMFLSTVDLGYKTVQAWVDNSRYGKQKNP